MSVAGPDSLGDGQRGEPFCLRPATALRPREPVHFLDGDGIPVDDAAGVEMVVRGLFARHEDDDALLRATLPVFDALYAAVTAPAR
jgi:hypothetical protein